MIGFFFVYSDFSETKGGFFLVATCPRIGGDLINRPADWKTRPEVFLEIKAYSSVR